MRPVSHVRHRVVRQEARGEIVQIDIRPRRHGLHGDRTGVGSAPELELHGRRGARGHQRLDHPRRDRPALPHRHVVRPHPDVRNNVVRQEARVRVVQVYRRARLGRRLHLDRPRLPRQEEHGLRRGAPRHQHALRRLHRVPAQRHGELVRPGLHLLQRRVGRLARVRVIQRDRRPGHRRGVDVDRADPEIRRLRRPRRRRHRRYGRLRGLSLRGWDGGEGERGDQDERRAEKWIFELARSQHAKPFPNKTETHVYIIIHDATRPWVGIFPVFSENDPGFPVPQDRAERSPREGRRAGGRPGGRQRFDLPPCPAVRYNRLPGSGGRLRWKSFTRPGPR